MHTESKRNDEIDLLDLIENGITLLKKYFILLVIAIIISVGIGFILIPKTSLPTYQISMLAYSRSLNDLKVAAILRNVQTLIDKGEQEILSKKLNLSKSDAANIIKIEVANLKDFESHIKSTAPDITFVIQVTLVEDKSLPNIQKGIIQYLENTEYVKKSTEIYKNELINTLAKIQLELKKLDSLKAIFKENSMVDPGNAYLQSVNLYKEELLAKKELAFINDIQVIEGFGQPQQLASSSTKKKLYLVGSSLAGIFLWVIVVMILEIKIQLQARRKKTSL